jgi:hypothetical protein
MGGKATTLAIRITSDNQSKAGFDDAGRSVGGFADKLDKASVVAGGMLAGIGALGKQAFDSASEMQQSAGSIEAVFGDMADAMKANAADAYESVGLSTSAYEQAAAVIGSQLKNAGMDAGKAFDTTFDLIQKGADMAAVFGGTASEAVDALSSALKGEMDPIEKYGISLNQAAIDAQKAADGHAKLTGAADKAAQTQAILELITRQSSQTQGQWSKQAGTAAESTQIAKAAWDNAAGTLGQRLLPFVTSGAKKLGEFATWAQNNQKTVTVLVGVLAGLAAAVLAVNAAVTVWGVIQKVSTALQWAWNVAMDANPIVLIVIAIAAVVAGVILMYNKFSWFRDFVGGIGHFVAAGFDVLKDVIKWIVDKIKWFIDHLTVFGWISKLSGHGSLFDAPAPAPAAQLYGAPAGGVALRTASLPTASSGSSGSSFDVGQLGTVVNLNVSFSGLVGDPVAVGQQIDRVVREWSRSTGRQPVAAMGGGNR